MEEGVGRTGKKKEWYLYILKCRDGTFYTGITTDIERRLDRHNKGLASKYTARRLPVEIVIVEKCGEKSDALKHEYRLKQKSRKEKEEYIAEHGKRSV